MVPFVLMALSLAQKKQQQNQADNQRISDSLNLNNDQQQNPYQLQVPNNNMMGGQQGAMGLLGSLFNKKDPNNSGF